MARPGLQAPCTVSSLLSVPAALDRPPATCCLMQHCIIAVVHCADWSVIC